MTSRAKIIVTIVLTSSRSMFVLFVLSFESSLTVVSEGMSNMQDYSADGGWLLAKDSVREGEDQRRRSLTRRWSSKGNIYFPGRVLPDVCSNFNWGIQKVVLQLNVLLF